MLKQQFMLIFSGPTAVGKSSIAESLAGKIPAEIVNADVGQLYQPLTIGTAKPDWQHAPVPHHLFDYITQPHNITVVEYRKELLEVINDIWQRGKLPLLVGGSSFYLASLFFPPRAELECDLPYQEDISAENLWAELYKIDKVRANAIHPQDVYRVKRALHIWHATGIKPSEYSPLYNPPADYWYLFFTRDTLQLHQRINARVKIMLNEGWIEEVRPLKNTDWEEFLRKKKLIGYDDILSYLDTNQTQKEKEHLIEVISRKTRYYAKKQRSFWRMLQHRLKQELAKEKNENNLILNPEVKTVDVTDLDIETYTDTLAKELSILFLPE